VKFGVEEVTVRFGATVALDRVTMGAGEGEITAVVGGDGAGKTTLLRTLVGLTEVETGIVRRPPARDIGYLATGAGSWGSLSVDENVEFVGGSYGLKGGALRTRADDLLGRCGLDSARDRLASQLSGGMRNKLGFCLAMLADPSLLVLDEPTTGVDPVSRIDLWRLISETAAAGTSVVMATTYVDEAERAATVTVLHEGRRLLQGQPEGLVASMTGAIAVVDRPIDGERAWRAGSAYREWFPNGTPPAIEAVPPTLADVSIVAELTARTQEATRSGA